MFVMLGSCSEITLEYPPGFVIHCSREKKIASKVLQLTLMTLTPNFPAMNSILYSKVSAIKSNSQFTIGEFQLARYNSYDILGRNLTRVLNYDSPIALDPTVETVTTVLL